METQSPEKICFLIAPIGEEDTEIRRRSDQVLRHIVEPAALIYGYATIRADRISEPGIITSQVIQHLVDDALVVADLSGHNPNVFYELAIRHAVRKPVVQLIQTGESIPFDVAATRTIRFDYHDIDSVFQCREELAKHIEAVESDPSNVDTPISIAIDLRSLRLSSNPLEKSSTQIVSLLQDLRSRIDLISGSSRTFSRIAEEELSHEMLTELARYIVSKHDERLAAQKEAQKRMDDREEDSIASGRAKS